MDEGGARAQEEARAPFSSDSDSAKENRAVGEEGGAVEEDKKLTRRKGESGVEILILWLPCQIINTCVASYHQIS